MFAQQLVQLAAVFIMMLTCEHSAELQDIWEKQLYNHFGTDLVTSLLTSYTKKIRIDRELQHQSSQRLRLHYVIALMQNASM